VRESFQHELARTERRVLRDLDLACATLDQLAVVVGDPAGPTPSLIENDGDRLRDGVRLSIEQLVTTCALQAPVATDLRLVTALFHIVHHQGLIANQFGLIVDQLMEIDPDERSVPELNSRLSNMATLASRQLGKAVAAFRARDAVAAECLSQDDDAIDNINREVFGIVLRTEGTKHLRELVFHQLLIARSLERLGDNAVDIAEQAAYLATGEYREFSDASTPRAHVGVLPSDAA
jgi:phosphate transport system protein